MTRKLLTTWCLLLFCTTALLGGGRLELCPEARFPVFIALDGAWVTGPEEAIVLSWNKDGLVLDASLQKADTPFKAAGKADDDLGLFGGDVLEFQIAPAGQKGVYYHFAFSPSGFAYTAKCRDSSWNPQGVMRQCTMDGTIWHQRLELPFAAIGEKTPAVGDVWKMNVGTTFIQKGKGREIASLSGVSDFHDVSNYADVVFEEAKDHRPPRLCRLESTPGKLCFRLDAPQLDESIYADVQLQGQSMPASCRKEGQFLVVDAELTNFFIPLKEMLELRLILKKSVEEPVFYECSGMLESCDSALTLDGFYYAGDEGVVTVKTAVPESVIRVYQGKRMLGQFRGPECRIPLASLEPGRYLVEGVFGKARTTRIFHKLTSVPKPFTSHPGAKFQLVPGQYLTLDGKPIYLLGISPTPKSFLQYGDVFNFASGRQGHGAGAVLNPSLPTGQLIRQPFTGIEYPVSDQAHLEQCRAFVQNLEADKPTLCQIAYEAQIPRVLRGTDGKKVPGDTAALLQGVYEEVKKARPDLLYTIQTDDPKRIAEYSRSCDVFECALYTSSYAVRMLQNLRVDLETIRSAITPRNKRLIYWLGGTVPNPECRLAEEIHAAVYLSMLEGCVGNIVHLGHGSLPEGRGRLWSLLSAICPEVNDIYADFVQGKPLAIDSTEDVVAKAVLMGDGGIMVIAINLTGVEKPLKTTVAERAVQEVLAPLEARILYF